MRDKPEAQERELPAFCQDCRSLHKAYNSPLCTPRRLRGRKLKLWKSIPLLGRFAPAWECDLRKYETVEDIEKEENC